MNAPALHCIYVFYTYSILYTVNYIYTILGWILLHNTVSCIYVFYTYSILYTVYTFSTHILYCILYTKYILYWDECSRTARTFFYITLIILMMTLETQGYVFRKVMREKIAWISKFCMEFLVIFWNIHQLREIQSKLAHFIAGKTFCMTEGNQNCWKYFK